jgi:hypothetical protein
MRRVLFQFPSPLSESRINTFIFNDLHQVFDLPQVPGTHPADSPSSADKCLDQLTDLQGDLP